MQNVDVKNAVLKECTSTKMSEDKTPELLSAEFNEGYFKIRII